MQTFAQTRASSGSFAGVGTHSGRSRPSLAHRQTALEAECVCASLRRRQHLSQSPPKGAHGTFAPSPRDLRCSASKDSYPERDDWAKTFEGPADGAPVQLRLYNIDRWGLAPIGARLLKKDVDGVYHVAVAVHSMEYWFDHQVNKMDLEAVTYVRGFGPAYVYDMGKTGLSPEEVQEFVFEELNERYNIDTYDCFFHNCHHFANELCLKLTNNRVPQWCIDHGEQGLSELGTESAKITRMVSNKIARLMMVSWGKYNKERFVERQREMEGNGSQDLSALNPTPIVGSGAPVNAMPDGVNTVGINKLLGGEGSSGNGVGKRKGSTHEAVPGRSPA